MADATKCAQCGAEYEVDDDEVAAAPAEAAQSESGCFMCKGQIVDGKCVDCGTESDEIPF